MDRRRSLLNFLLLWLRPLTFSLLLLLFFLLLFQLPLLLVLELQSAMPSFNDRIPRSITAEVLSDENPVACTKPLDQTRQLSVLLLSPFHLSIHDPINNQLKLYNRAITSGY
jgi:hypothetical protein